MTEPKGRRPEEKGETFVQALIVYSAVLGQFLGLGGAGLAVGWFAWRKLGAPAGIVVLTVGAGLFLASVRVIRLQKKIDSGKRSDRA